MPRPRKSAKALELSGAFVKNPQRARVDLAGAGPSDLKPPAHLPKEMHSTWKYVIDRLPKVTLTRSEEMMVESTVRIYYRFKHADDKTEEFRRLAQTLLTHLSGLGMTVASRAKLGQPVDRKKQNPFRKLREKKDESQSG